MQKNNSGQAIISIIIILLIGLTIALGIYLSSLSGTKVTSIHDNSEVAFNIADAAIEEVIRKSAGSLSQLAQSTTPLAVDVGNFSSTVTVAQDNTFNMTVALNDAVTIPLENGNATSVKIFWTREVATCPDDRAAALIIDKWTKNTASNTITVTHIGKNSANCNNDPSNQIGFNNDGVSNPGGNFQNLFTLSGLTPMNGSCVGNCDLFLRIRPIYNKSNIKVVGDVGELPAQQFGILSKASIEGSNETRAIQVAKSVPDLPSIFDYALFSGSAIIK